MLRLPATCRPSDLGRLIGKALRRLAVAGSLLALASCQTQRSGEPGPEVLRGLEFTSDAASPFEVSSLAGRPFLLHFMFTTCPSACPRAVQLLAKTRAELSPELRQRVAVVSVSVDPEHDTPEALRAFAIREGAQSDSWHFVRPSAASLEQLSKRLTVFEPDAPEVPSRHSLTIYLFDARGRPLQRYSASDTEASHLARELVALDRVQKNSASEKSGT